MVSPIYTPTAIQRWSCSGEQLPPVSDIKRIHVYDFDNTLFLSPLPNKQLWNTSTFGALQSQDYLHDGGWWHNPNILAATGEGEEKEEARAWKGSWNEHIVDLAKDSQEDPSALSVLLTGRGEAKFSALLQKIFKAKGLRFDIVALKPAVSPTGEKFNDTLQFKKTLLRNIVYTYREATELRMYEDRPKHTSAFRKFFEELNEELGPYDASEFISTEALPAPRGALDAEVIQVAEVESSMDPVKEVAQVQDMINRHNKAMLEGKVRGGVPYKIKRSVFYTGYLISPDDSSRLKALVNVPAYIKESEVKWLANNILIAPRPATREIMDQVGGMGAVMRWTITGVGSHEDRVWAARVTPTNAGARIYTENKTPCVVLATRRLAKPIEASQIRNWQPVSPEQSFQFDTTVGEKVLLRIDEEKEGEDDYEASFASSKNGKRFRDDEFPPLGPRAQNKGQRQKPGRTSRPSGIGSAASRGGRGGQQQRGRRDNRGGGTGRGRGRGAYRSLDASVGQSYGGSPMEY